MQLAKLVSRSLGVALALTFSAGAMADDIEKVVVPEQKLSPPLVDWKVDKQAAIAEVRAKFYAGAKAPNDKATVFRPVPVCRLVDTRGFPAAVVVPGPLPPDSTTNISTNEKCGIPTSFVAGLSLSVSVQNLTPNSGGFITLLQQGSPVTGVNAVLNFNTVWTATTANVSLPNSSGDFSVFLATASANVIIDVNGYFQDLNELDVGTQQFDLTGSANAQTFQFENTATNGTALTASATGSNGIALRIVDGKIGVAGIAGVNGDDAVFVHETELAAYPTGTLCNTTTAAEWTILDHPMLNNNPNAAIFIQPRDATTAPPTSPGDGAFHAWYFVTQGACTSASAVGKWSIRARSGVDFLDGQRFNVMIITP